MWGALEQRDLGAMTEYTAVSDAVLQSEVPNVLQKSLSFLSSAPTLPPHCSNRTLDFQTRLLGLVIFLPERLSPLNVPAYLFPSRTSPRCRWSVAPPGSWPWTQHLISIYLGQAWSRTFLKSAPVPGWGGTVRTGSSLHCLPGFPCAHLHAKGPGPAERPQPCWAGRVFPSEGEESVCGSGQ